MSILEITLWVVFILGIIGLIWIGVGDLVKFLIKDLGSQEGE